MEKNKRDIVERSKQAVVQWCIHVQRIECGTCVSAFSWNLYIFSKPFTGLKSSLTCSTASDSSCHGANLPLLTFQKWRPDLESKTRSGKSRAKRKTGVLPCKGMEPRLLLAAVFPLGKISTVISLTIPLQHNPEQQTVSQLWNQLCETWKMCAACTQVCVCVCM